MNTLVKYLTAKFLGTEIVYRINVREAKKLGVQVGSDCRFIDTSASSFSTEPFLIEIGSHVSMTRPTFITHDGSVWVFRKKYPEIELFGKIVIGDNCFLGEGVLILPQTKVGNNCIVGAQTLLKGEYPDNSVIAGIPGKRIGSIEEFYDKNIDRFTYIRNLSSSDKKSELIRRFR